MSFSSNTNTFIILINMQFQNNSIRQRKQKEEQQKIEQQKKEQQQKIEHFLRLNMWKNFDNEYNENSYFLIDSIFEN